MNTNTAKVIRMTPQQDIQAAKDTIKTEADALYAMAESLGQNYVEAIELLDSCKGRVIVTGMGKSGHVARKMAATFSSTGTQAYFVHPAEASHGDMGMISEEDVVIALSRSGETRELKDILNYTARFDIPLISITLDEHSSLGQHSTIVLKLPDKGEVCPNGKAPTTSTTMTMALGDALAISLMRRNGFSAEDFGLYHPGGKLGASIKKVCDIMRTEQELPLTSIDATMEQAIKAMSLVGDNGRSFGRAIIVDENENLIGFISDGDIRRHLDTDLLKKPVKDVMTANPKQIDQSDLAAKALAIMNEYSITELIVTDGKKPIGMIRLHDVLKAGIA